MSANPVPYPDERSAAPPPISVGPVVVPRFSVVTVCLNGAATLLRAMESLLTQSHAASEYVIVDGGSTDGTLDIIQTAAHRFEDMGVSLKWVSEPDGGLYDAMNKGLGMVTGEVAGILNSDDFYEPDTLQAVACAAVRRPGVGIFYGFLRILQRDGVEVQTCRYRYENYLLNPESGVFSGTQHPTCFVRRSVYERIGNFDTQFPIAADYDFLVRAMRAGVPFHPIDRVLSNFTLGGRSDRMGNYERLRQRYGVMLKNGLLTESEYRKRQSEVRYNRYKEMKGRIAGLLFGMRTH